MPVADVQNLQVSVSERFQNSKEKKKNETKAIISLLCTLTKTGGVASALDLHVFRLEKIHR